MDYTKNDTTSRTSNISAADWQMFMEMTERQQDAWLAEQWFVVSSEPFDPGALCDYCNQKPHVKTERGDMRLCASCAKTAPLYDPENDQPEQWEIEENGGPTLVEIRQYRWPNTPDAEEYVATVEANRDGPAWSQVAC